MDSEKQKDGSGREFRKPEKKDSLLQETNQRNRTPEQEAAHKKLDIPQALSQETTLLEKFRGRAKEFAKVFIFISSMVAVKETASQAHAHEQHKSATEHVEHEPTPMTLPDITFKQRPTGQLAINDPAASAMRYRSPYDLKGERVQDVPEQGQLIFYQNTLETYGNGPEANEINKSRITHELFHAQFDKLSGEQQDQIADYFVKKNDFTKMKDYLTNKSEQYEDSYNKTKKYENGENKARNFIVNEFVAHAVGFEHYTPTEPDFLIDLLEDSGEMLAEHGFSRVQQKELMRLLQEAQTDSPEQNEKIQQLQESKKEAKKSAQQELKAIFETEPELAMVIKINAALTRKAYTYFDSDYFEFQAAGFDLDDNDYIFLKSQNIDVDQLRKHAQDALTQMQEAKKSEES